MRSAPELCSGVHQQGCDLEGVEGATPHTSLTHIKTMTTAILFNRVTTARIQTQDLTDDQLEMVSGGVNETCRMVRDPKTGGFYFISELDEN